jgi:hypothetical protein
MFPSGTTRETPPATTGTGEPAEAAINHAVATAAGG